MRAQGSDGGVRWQKVGDIPVYPVGADCLRRPQCLGGPEEVAVSDAASGHDLCLLREATVECDGRKFTFSKQIDVVLS